MTTPTGLAAPDNDAPVSPLAWLTLASLLVAGLAWYWFSSYAIPRCDTRQTVVAVTDGKFSLHDVNQAGYAWSQKTRGCLATVMQDSKPLQYAWTILKHWHHARKYCLAWFPAAGCWPATTLRRLPQARCWPSRCCSKATLLSSAAKMARTGQ